MLERKTLTELRSDLDAAVAADDVPSLATAAAELRAQVHMRRMAGGDLEDLPSIDALRERANYALASRLSADVEAAATTEITIPDDYQTFAAELEADDPGFAPLAARTRDVFASRLVAGPSGSEEGD